MSVLVIMFVKLLNFECFVSWSKRFFAAFAASYNGKGENASFFNLNNSQKFSYLPAQCATVLYDLEIVAILLANS